MNLPTKITISRIIAIALMFIAMIVLNILHYAIGFNSIPLFGPEGFEIDLIMLIFCAFFAIASFTDYLDGHLARKNNQVTDLGKFLDPVADKLLINIFVIFLAAVSLTAPYALSQHLSISIWCAILIIARDIVVDALRFIAANKKVVIAANMFGKAKTVLEMVAIILVLLNGWPFSYLDHSWPTGLRITDFVVYAATFVSILSGIIYVVQNKHVFKEGKKDGE